MLMIRVKKLMLEIRSQYSFKSKSEWIPFLIWHQMCSLTILLNKISNKNYLKNYYHVGKNSKTTLNINVRK